MNESLGQRIRRFRKERNLSQSDLGDLVGVTISWISQIEQDKATPSAELLQKIASVYKIPMRELIQNEDEHMELVSKIKLVEVLLETHQSLEAERILDGIDDADISESDKITVTVLLAECKYQQSLYNESLRILLPIIQKLENENHHDAFVLAWIRYMIGKTYYQLRDFTNALYSYRKAYEYTKRIDTPETLTAKITYNLGVTLRMKGFNKESLPFLEEAHAYFQKNNDLKTLAYTLFEKGITYKNSKSYTKASECFAEAKAIIQSLNLNNLYVILQHTVASEITLQHDPPLALEQLFECLDLVMKESNTQRAVLIHSKIARVYIHLDDYEKAAVSLQSAQILIEKCSLQKTVEAAEYHKVYAQYLTQIGDYEKSVKHALASSNIFGNIGLAIDQIEALQIVTNAYEVTGDYKMALFYEREGKRIALDVRRG